MPERISYSKAPIIEAIIDLRVVARPSLTTEDLLRIHERVAEEYPSREKEHTFSGEVLFQDSGEPLRTESDHQVTGLRFVSGDQRCSLLARPDQFVFSIRAPYDTWEEFRDEAYRLWNVYREVAEPTQVTRSALRYINRIDIPSPDRLIDLEDYLKIYPESPGDSLKSSMMMGFFMQLQLWQQDLDCWLIVNEAPETPPVGDVVSVRLDFDLFREAFDSPWEVEDDAAWGFLESLHTRKNEAFEASITNRTRRLIK